MATSGICKAFHFEKTNLVKAASEDVDDVAVVSSALGKVVVEFQCLLVVLDVVSVDVVMRSDGLSQLRTHHHARTFSCRTTSEEHDSASSILEGSLEQTDSHAQSYTRAPQRALVVRDRPGISLQLLKSVGELEFALLHREEESSSWAHWLRSSARLRLDTWHPWTKPCGHEAKHFLYLLRGVVLAASEYIGFGALSISNLVYLCHCAKGDETNQGIWRQKT